MSTSDDAPRARQRMHTCYARAVVGYCFRDLGTWFRVFGSLVPLMPAPGPCHCCTSVYPQARRRSQTSSFALFLFYFRRRNLPALALTLQLCRIVASRCPFLPAVRPSCIHPAFQIDEGELIREHQGPPNTLEGIFCCSNTLWRSNHRWSANHLWPRHATTCLDRQSSNLFPP